MKNMGWSNDQKKRLAKREPALLFPLLLAALALPVSCSGPFESSAPAPIAPGLGQAVISLGGGERTLMPEMPAFVKYVLLFTAPGKPRVSEDLTEAAAMSSLEGSGYGVDLEPGTWALTVTAYTRPDPAAGYLEAARNTPPLSVSIAPGASVDVAATIDPLPVDGAQKGFFIWDIDLPALGSADSAELIYALKGGPSLTEDLKAAPSGSAELDSGYYVVTILLVKDGKTAGRTEGAHIYPGLTTRAGANRPEFTVFTDTDFGDLKYLAGTAAVVKPDALTLDSLYVQAYEDPACAVPIVTDPALTTVSAGGKWSMKVPATLEDVYFRLATSGGGRSFDAAAGQETGVPANGKPGIALSTTIYALSRTISGQGSVGMDVARQDSYALEGETVVLTLAPDSGHGLKAGTLQVRETAGGAPVTLSDSGSDGSTAAYRFVMPAAAITVSAEFVAIGSSHAARRGITLYESLEAAIDAAPALSASGPDEIILLKDIELPESGTEGYVINKHIKLASGDSAGNTITRESGFTGSLFTVGSGASLALDGSPHALVIDGNNVSASAALITVEGGTLDMYDGVTLKNNQNTGVNHGGGVRITNGSLPDHLPGSFTMNGGTISGNSAGGNGGAVYVNKTSSSETGSRFAMKGGTIGGSGTGEKNTAANGGGVMVSGGASFVMTAGSITGNSATSSGGGVDISGSSFTMKAGFITGNTAANGGGVGIIGSPNAARFEMQNGSVTGNTAGSNGGGVHISGSNSLFEMQDGFITGNKAGNNSNGGGVYINGSGSRFAMQGGTLGGTGEANTVGANGSGGGVYVANPGEFAMSGSASLIGNGVHVFGTITMEGGARVIDEWVYLTSGAVITLRGAMTGTAPVAVIYPEVTTPGTPVLTEIGTGTLVQDYEAKFNSYISSTTYSGAANRIDSYGKITSP